MAEKKALPGLAKKHYVLLPTHRPPLRRDKPVRISLPEIEPSYRFPSTERSFIFIPRALRPNQQGYMRGRGRGSFQGSRRTSVLGGSSYTPSVAMSRKSSLGGVMRDNVRSPAGSSYGRPTGMDPVRPIVRLPSATPMMGSLHMPPMMLPAGPMPVPDLQQFLPPPMNGATSHGVHTGAIPLHQPKPQKALSLTNIESPAALSVKAPQPQEEQPFHQQVPPYVQPDDTRPQQPGPANAAAGGAPTHIPEGAIYAQPFQPYPVMQGSMFYPGQYINPVMYPAAEPLQGTGWGNGMFPGMMPGHAAPTAQTNTPHGAPVAHEQNGMVFYSDPNMGQAVQPQYAMGGQPAMMPAQNMYGYYMTPTFYQAQ